MIIVQEIQFAMSKWHRRAVGIGELYRAPEALPVPFAKGALGRSNEPLLHHTLRFGVRNISFPVERLIPTDPEKPLLIGGVTVQRTAEGQAQVAFHYTRACGAPDRGWAWQTFLVGPGEWAQVRYNGRFPRGYGDYWSYEKTVVNVGVFSKPRDEMFLKKPTYRYSLMSELW